MILATTPAPTVRPPSRMAKRKPSSIAIGLISLTVMLTLSPGITVKLINPIAMEEGLRFAIREGGRTVGAGVVAKIIE